MPDNYPFASKIRKSGNSYVNTIPNSVIAMMTAEGKGKDPLGDWLVVTKSTLRKNEDMVVTYEKKD